MFNQVPDAGKLNVEALEKSLIEKLAKLDNVTKNTLGLDEEPVPRE